MNVYTYYDSSPDAPSGQAEAFRTWATSWSAAGWAPRILTSRMAKQSSLYAETHQRLDKAISNALPWLAFHTVGGGWLFPMQVLNAGLEPTRRASKVIFYYPGILWATRRGVEEILQSAWTKQWDTFFQARFKTENLGIANAAR